MKTENARTESGLTSVRFIQSGVYVAGRLWHVITPRQVCIFGPNARTIPAIIAKQREAK